MLVKSTEIDTTVRSRAGPGSSYAGREHEAVLRLRMPKKTDGAAVHRMIGSCPPLDPNSVYCNLLQCTHFASTCVVAEQDEAVVGFLSAYRQPLAPEVLFIWQIAVAGSCRGRGLAAQMLDHVLQRSELQDIRFLETTITPNNQASAALFTRFASRYTAEMVTAPLFTKAEHFADKHDDEVLYRIGPFAPLTHS